MKKIKLIVFLGLLALIPAILIGCSTSEAEYKVANAYLTIDINPSVEIITGDDGLVAQVNPLNADAEVLLVDTDFAGKTVDEATTAIVQLAIDMGYIDFTSENAIIITAEAGEETENLEKTLSEKVTDFVNERQIKLDVLKANFEATPDMKQLASDLGISIGKLKLITVAMANDVELTVENAAQMSVRDLNRIIINARREVRNFYNVEFRDSFHELQQELQFNFLKEKTTLLNTAIQNAEVTAFADIELTEEQVIEVKTLYQAYLDEMKTIDLNAETVNPESTLDSQVMFEKAIEALQQTRTTLRERLTLELENAKTNTGNNNNLNEENRQSITEKINGIRNQMKEIDNRIENTIRNFEANCVQNNYGKFQFRSRFYGHRWGNESYNQVKDLNEKYEDLFAELNVELDDLEEIFAPAIKADLDILRAEHKEALETQKLEYVEQSLILKEQLIDEKQALINIWKNK